MLATFITTVFQSLKTGRTSQLLGKLFCQKGLLIHNSCRILVKTSPEDGKKKIMVDNEKHTHIITHVII